MCTNILCYNGAVEPDAPYTLGALIQYKNPIERMLFDPKNAYHHRWKKEIAAAEQAARRYVYQTEWKREAEKTAFYQEIREEIAFRTHPTPNGRCGV